MKIYMESQPAVEMRYGTCGDWFYSDSGSALIVKVAEYPGCTEDELFLVAVHELVEAYLCKKRGISEESVTKFDLAWRGDEIDEPGDHAEAPYRREHRFAMLVEHIIAHELGISDYGTIR